jgi:predicted O-linked N-acetylglucosamine transferase (SPINDLY family)
LARNWAGFNSNLESLPHDRPIVTFAGRLMRSNHTAAVMRVMGMHDAIAGSVGEYIAKAVRFGRDPEMRMAEGRRIAASKQHVYRDRTPIEALERLLERAVRTGNQTG